MGLFEVEVEICALLKFYNVDLISDRFLFQSHMGCYSGRFQARDAYLKISTSDLFLRDFDDCDAKKFLSQGIFSCCISMWSIALIM